jgi:hypothetical protein
MLPAPGISRSMTNLGMDKTPEMNMQKQKTRPSFQRVRKLKVKKPRHPIRANPDSKRRGKRPRAAMRAHWNRKLLHIGTVPDLGKVPSFSSMDGSVT